MIPGMLLTRFATFFACVSIATAQTVWSMGAPWTDLAAVLVAAAPGDIVRLNGLTFPPFVLSKGLTMIGPGVIAAASGTAPLTTLSIPPGENAQLVDVDFQPFTLPVIGLLGGHRVVAQGSVTFDNCTFRQGNPHNLETAGTVLLHRCTVAGDATSFAQQRVGGMVVQSGYCSLVDCTIAGGNAVFCGGCVGNYVPATVALRVNGGTVAASNTTFVGGSGGTGGVFVPTPGVPAVQTAGITYLADCSLTAGANPAGAPVPPLLGVATTSYARTTFGSVTTPQSNVPQLVGLQMSPSLRIGQASTITAIAGSTSLLGILAGFDGAVGTHPVVVEPVLVPVWQLVTLAEATPSAGSAVTHSLLVPNLGSLIGLVVYVQAFQLDGVQVRASAPLGGAVR
jgi:hypothetical protein